MGSDYDVIIVGAGPAGAAAAYDLAAWGRSVLLLDRYRFPRTKACAGALTLKTVRALRFSVQPVVRTVCRTLLVREEDGSRRRVRRRDGVCLLTVRSDLDAFCLHQACSRGAEFQVARLRGVLETTDAVVADTDRGPVRARFLLGADGADSRVRRESGDFPEAVLGFALETCVESAGATSSDLRRCRDLATVFHFDAIPEGYGWLFPKGDHWNVGLYSRRGPGSLGRGHLERYLAENGAEVGLAGGRKGRVVGHTVGLGGHLYRPQRRRVLLLGDAAGLVFPRWAEGIYHAVVSGQLAAAAVQRELEGGGEAREAYREALRPLQRDLVGRYRSLTVRG